MISPETSAALKYIAAQRDLLPTVQGEEVAKARAGGATWPEIAAALGLSEAGVRRMQARYLAGLNDPKGTS